MVGVAATVEHDSLDTGCLAGVVAGVCEAFLEGVGAVLAFAEEVAVFLVTATDWLLEELVDSDESFFDRAEVGF